MKNIFTLLILTLLGSVLYAQSHRNCGTTAYMDKLAKTHPEVRKAMMVPESVVKDWVKNNPQKGGNIIRIPVIVHVLYNSNYQNISDAQIQSQIDVLNEDYRKLNADTSKIPSLFDTLAADIGIEFCFAHQTPSGGWTNGVTRTHTTKTSFDLSQNDCKFSSTGGVDAWDTRKYLNIWVVPEIVDGGSTGILGYAQFPGGPTATDGVVIGFHYFGTQGTVQYPYNKGRTTTHELGHWLGLYHIWGDDNGSCSGSDDVNDTPNQADYNQGCPSFPHPSCNNTSDMFMNYMDYTDDRCMMMFSKGQRDRMQYYLTHYRSSIMSSTKCQVVSLPENSIAENLNIYPVPARDMLNIDFGSELDAQLDVELYNALGQLVLSEIFEANASNFQLSTASLKNGIYYLHLVSDKFNINRTIEILR